MRRARSESSPAPAAAAGSRGARVKVPSWRQRPVSPGAAICQPGSGSLEKETPGCCREGTSIRGQRFRGYAAEASSRVELGTSPASPLHQYRSSRVLWSASWPVNPPRRRTSRQRYLQSRWRTVPSRRWIRRGSWPTAQRATRPPGNASSRWLVALGHPRGSARPASRRAAWINVALQPSVPPLAERPLHSPGTPGTRQLHATKGSAPAERRRWRSEAPRRWPHPPTLHSCGRVQVSAGYHTRRR